MFGIVSEVLENSQRDTKDLGLRSKFTGYSHSFYSKKEREIFKRKVLILTDL